MRLIDADKLEKELEKMTQDFLNDKTIQGNFCAGVTVETLEEVRKAPTVDAVPVVRCGECKKRGTYKCPLYPGEHIGDYCSYGERKEKTDETD